MNSRLLADPTFAIAPVSLQLLMMDRALRRVYELLPNPDRAYYATAFGQFADIKNSARKFKLIREAIDSEQLGDYLAEIRYALIFRCLGFVIEAEPFGDDTKGPDFKISRGGAEAYVEVRRLRPTGGGPPMLSDPDQTSDSGWLLEEYGDLEKEVRKGFAVITEKFRQLRERDGILAFWNSNEDFDELSLEHAVRLFLDHPEIHRVPPGLSFILFGSSWRCCGSDQKLCCFPVRSLKPHEEKWRAQLEKVENLANTFP